MSGAQTSTFADPNVLLQTLSGAQTAAVQRNQLLNQLGQQEVAANNTEVVARAASTLLDPTLYPTEEARAAAWPGIIGQLKANGYAPNAPEAYPGLDHIKATARMGTPSKDLLTLQLTTQGGQDTLRALGIGSTGTGAGGGTGTGDAGTGGGGGGALSGDTYEGAIGGHEGLGADKSLPSTVGGFRPGTWQGFVTANPNLFAGMSADQAMAARSDPKFNAAGISWLAQQNATQLAQAGVKPSGMALGIAHYIGAGAAAKALQAPDNTPVSSFVSPDAVRFNPELGTMTVGQLKARYAGVPDPGFLKTATAGPPGGSTAPGVVTGDVGRPGDVPPPPGGAPGAYGGGGFGAVVARPPVVGTSPIPAGRPTGPPVVTDQPAGGGVVAGPPGTAVVGAPQPPSPEVPGNVAAINAGIVGAGGQPVTDPNLTPTPARYAGTAPAPSVEAPPQSGWGTGIGTYGPQNTLAPSPPVPAQPAATTPAAQPAPSVATSPAATVPPLPQPPVTRANGFTSTDEAVLSTMAARGYTREQILTEADKRRTANISTQRQYVLDVQAQQEKAKADAIAAENLRLSQESGGRDTQRLQFQQAEAAVKAKQARMAYQGTDIGAQDTNVLMTADPKSKEYAIAYQRMAAPHYNQDGSVVYPNLSAFQKPGYVPPGASEPPDYGAAKVTPPTILTQDQARAGTYADRMTESNAIMSQLDNAAIDYVQKGLSKIGGTVGFGMNSSDYQRVKQAQENFVNATLRLESGAVISEDEFKKASQQYFPQPGDSAAVIAQKKANREAEISGFVREAGPGYKPKAPEATAPTRIIRYDHTGKRIAE